MAEGEIIRLKIHKESGGVLSTELINLAYNVGFMSISIINQRGQEGEGGLV